MKSGPSAAFTGSHPTSEGRRNTASPEISTEILVDIKAHVDFLETRLALPRGLGEQINLQSAMGELGESSVQLNPEPGSRPRIS